MISVALTGGIASGKSTVAAMLREAGATVLDSDQLAHAAIEPCGEAYPRVVAAFGPGVLTPSGTVDRAVLGGIIFENPAKRLLLNSIVHPVVERRLGELTGMYRSQGLVCLITDVPLLYEVGWENRFDRVIVVFTRGELQMERLRQRNQLTDEQAQQRLDAQMSLEEKARRADYLIDNSGSLDNTREQVLNVWSSLMLLAAGVFEGS